MSASRESFDADRRRFLKTVGLTGIASIGAPMMALTQSKPAAGIRKRGAKPKREPAAAPVAEKPPEISEDARTLAQVVKRRYGQHLNPEQLENVTKEIDGRLQGGQKLRESRLANGDEPDFTFHA